MKLLKAIYHKAHLIDKSVEICKKEKIKYKAINDGNVIVEKFKGTNEEGENE